MNQSWIRDSRKNVQEFAPYELLLLFICPKAMLTSTVGGSDANADQVIEIATRQTFDMEIYFGSVEFRDEEIDNVNLFLADRQCTQ